MLAWFHNLDPVIVRIYGDFALRWYGLAYVCGFVAAYFLLRTLARRSLIALRPEQIGDVMLWFIGGTLIGGRLGYALFYDRSLLYTRMDHMPFWKLLAINEGGMASHGGIIGTILAAWVISRRYVLPLGTPPLRPGSGSAFMHVCDLLAFAAPAGLFFGRMANFVNGELLGRVVARPGEPSPWWAVQYPQELALHEVAKGTGLPIPGEHLVQTPEQWQRILDLAKSVGEQRGLTLNGGLNALAHEGWRYADQLRPLISARHPSQLYQALTDGPILAAILIVAWARPRKPGVVGSLFLVAYGVLRILTEILRLPDAQFGEDPRPFGLSRGQWLSVLMVVIGLPILFYAARRAAPKIGGWRGPG